MTPPCPVCEHSARRIDLALDTVDCYKCDACETTWIQQKDDPKAPPRYVTTPEPKKPREAS